MKTKTILLSMSVLVLLGATSCNQTKSGDKKVATIDANSPDAKKIKDDVVKMISTLPSHHETTKLINETGASFIAGLTEEEISTDELLTRAHKAKTFGEILFDLGYTDTYNQVESFTKLLKIQEDLTQQLGFEELITLQKPYRERYLNNKNNRDSLDAIVTDLLKSTNNYIREHGSATDISLIFASATAKALYVVSTVTLFARSNEKLIQLMENQKEHLNAALSILEMTSEDPAVKSMLESLKPVKEVFTTSSPFNIDAVDKINQLTAKVV